MKKRRIVLILAATALSISLIGGSVFAATVPTNLHNASDAVTSSTPKVEKKKPSKGHYIGKTKAKKIALKDAKISASSAKALKVKLEKDDGYALYEVEFRKGAKEYDYEVKATSGKILDRDVERYNPGRPSN
ncbi:MAG: PepSY domain-containing protein [Anaerovoracaceae bacterium]